MLKILALHVSQGLAVMGHNSMLSKRHEKETAEANKMFSSLLKDVLMCCLLQYNQAIWASQKWNPIKAIWGALALLWDSLAKISLILLPLGLTLAGLFKDKTEGLGSSLIPLRAVSFCLAKKIPLLYLSIFQSGSTLRQYLSRAAQFGVSNLSSSPPPKGVGPSPPLPSSSSPPVPGHSLWLLHFR